VAQLRWFDSALGNSDAEIPNAFVCIFWPSVFFFGVVPEIGFTSV
jgi:hypothetical protein